MSVMTTGVVNRPVRSRGAPGFTPEVVRGAVGATAAVTTPGAGLAVFTNSICSTPVDKSGQLPFWYMCRACERQHGSKHDGSPQGGE